MKSTWHFSQSKKKGLWILFLILALIISGRWWILVEHPTKAPLPLPPEHLLRATTLRLDTLDINTASAADLTQFRGIGPVLSKRIIKFREASGGFRHIADITKVYGLEKTTVEYMLPYLYLSPPIQETPRLKQHPYSSRKKKIPAVAIDINSADSTSWASLPGIGPVLSQRIIKYRKLTGGFSNKEELRKVYGLSPKVYESLLPYLRLSDSLPPKNPLPLAMVSEESPQRTFSKQQGTSRGLDKGLIPIDINLADSTQLEALPGIGPTLARRIIAYRNIIGFYGQLSFLKKVYGLRDHHYRPAIPFLYIDRLPPPREDLNTISLDKLRYFPFIGEELLDRFSQERKEIGRFLDWQEFQEVMNLSEEELGCWKQYFLI
ncbi:MAG: helix-hairpin-helix domain-containing protein [Bacteroidota bacterium]